MGELIKSVISGDGKRRVDFYRREDGFFWFHETFEVEEFDERFPGDHNIYRSPGVSSGLYRELSRAEDEAGLIITWLKSASE